MNNPTHIVISDKEIQEVPKMEKPLWADYRLNQNEVFLKDYEAYNEHLASLPTIQRADNGKWKKGQELTKGVDFEITDNIGGDKLIFAYGLVTRVWCTSNVYGYGCAECCNGDRCDEDCTAKYKGSRKKDCPHSKGKSYIPFEDAKEISVAIPIEQQEQQEEMPDFDGDYLCLIEKIEECGVINKLWRVVKCDNNQWKIEKNEKVLSWQVLPDENKWKGLLAGRDKPFFVDTFRKLLNQYDKEEISISKFVECLNIEAFKWHQSKEQPTPQARRVKNSGYI